MPKQTQEGGKKIKVTLVKGFIGIIKSHRATAQALGFRKRNQTIEKIDTPEVRGMINTIRYMVEVSE